MADTIRDVVVRIKLQQVAGKATDSGVRKAERDLEQTVKKQQSSMKQVAQNQATVRQQAKQTTEALKKSTETISDRSLEIGQSLQDIGDGFFTTARGAAFLFTSTEEGFGEMVKTLADVQGSFDSFRGTLQITRGSLTALGLDAGKAGVVGVGIASLTGAISFGISIFRRYSREARQVREEEKKQAEERRRLAAETERYAFLLQRVTRRQDFLRGLNQQRDAFAEILANVRGLNVEQQKLGRLRDQQARNLGQAGVGLEEGLFGAFGPGGNIDLGRFGNIALNGDERFQRFARAGLPVDPIKALENLAAGKGGVERVENDRFGQLLGLPAVQNRELNPNRQEQLNANKVLERFQKATLENLKAQVQVRARLIQQNNSLLQREKDRLKTLKDQLKAQKESVQSQQASVGRLTPGQQNRLRQLIQGQKAGTLNRGQLLQLEQLGGGINAVRQAVDAEFAKRGQGVANFAAQQLGGAPLTGQGSKLQSIQQRIKQQQEVVVQVAETISDDNQRMRDGIEGIAESFKRTAEKLEGVQKRIDELERQNQQQAIVP